jgi:60 kDa SS-A/Ro ribonucleoprotein
MRENAYTRAFEPASVTEPIAGTIKNHDGGAVYDIGDLARARRFLIIGSNGGTYYQSERDITRENVDGLRRLIAEKPIEFVDLIRDVSVRGLAPKLDPQLFALAMCTAQPGPARAEAFRLFPVTVRTGSHLLTWARYHKLLGGKVGRSWRRAVSQWYTERSFDGLAYQLAKYKQRDGWAQKDLIDMSHALAGQVGATATTLRWARGEKVESAELPKLLTALEREDATAGELIAAGASWEMLPDKAKRKRETWELLLDQNSLPLGAMLRQLPRLTELEVIDAWFTNHASQLIGAKLMDEEQLRKARIHPLGILMAARQYAGGRSRSGLSYRPNNGVLEVLDQAFYKAFETAPASGKRTLIGVDVSPSMTSGYTDLNGLTAAEIAIVLAMKIIRTEPASMAVGFASEIRELGIQRGDSLQTGMSRGQALSRMWGATNPGALIEFATKQKLEVDTFVVVTDNEVNRGFHVPQLLAQYRRQTGIPAKLCVLATSVTNMSIADPSDPGMLDIAGFGADVPALLTEFSRGF